jgi:hypothetical protein
MPVSPHKQAEEWRMRPINVCKQKVRDISARRLLAAKRFRKAQRHALSAQDAAVWKLIKQGPQQQR